MNKKKKEQKAKVNPQMTEQELLLAEETLRNAERQILIHFVKGVMLYRITEITKQKVLKSWDREDFEEMLHSATKTCNKMRDEVDKMIDDLIDVVPEIRAYQKELEASYNKIKEEEEKK